MRRKPCGRLLTHPDGSHTDCPYERMKGKQRCVWHWLAAQPADTQGRVAQQRLAASEPNEHVARVPKADWPAGERWCAGCQSFVPLFYASGSRCKACSSSASHGARVEKVYGITAEQYDALLRRQGGRCAICRNKPRSMRLAVDHDHQSDDVRGLLCKRCNHDLLGGGHDDVEMLWRAIQYLLFPPAMYDPSSIERGHVLAALDERLAIKGLLAQRSTPEALPAPF